MTLDALLAFARSSPMLSLIFVGLTLAIVYTEIARLFRGYKSISPAILTQLLNRDNALLIDVSALADFEKGHIPGAKNVLPSQLDPARYQKLVFGVILVVMMIFRPAGILPSKRRAMELQEADSEEETPDYMDETRRTEAPLPFEQE